MKTRLLDQYAVVLLSPSYLGWGGACVKEVLAHLLKSKYSERVEKNFERSIINFYFSLFFFALITYSRCDGFKTCPHIP